MSKSLSSPAAQLLQSSRLFSLPKPLPPPSLATGAATQSASRLSESATLPYPTLQAIATPASSHGRGDFGLKRALPRRKLGAVTHSHTPVVRIRAQDNLQHITDFESAGDHVNTEKKWRQMGVPLIVKEQRSSYALDKAPQSVYDSLIDNTDPNVVGIGATPEIASSRAGRAYSGFQQNQQKQRWKYDGPWIPGMKQGEFDEYVSQRLTRRKAEFRRFLTKRMLQRRIHDEERSNRERGLGGALTTARIEQMRAEVEADYETEEKKLRDDHIVQGLASELTAAICDFLDLPGIRLTQGGPSARTQGLQNLVSAFASADNGPPSTHPGAGLSHIRSNAFMENHPHWGPQAHRTPVKARVVRPRSGSVHNEYQAKLGVAGVVANDPVSATYQSAMRNNVPGYGEEEKEAHYLDSDRMTHQIDENLPGGNKIWVQPETASIDEAGRINLAVSRGDKEAVAVRRGQVEQIHQARSAGSSGIPYVGRPAPGRANYGHALPDTRPQSPPRQRMRGFDEELGRSPQQGRMPDSDAAKKIEELLAGKISAARK